MRDTRLCIYLHRSEQNTQKSYPPSSIKSLPPFLIHNSLRTVDQAHVWILLIPKPDDVLLSASIFKWNLFWITRAIGLLPNGIVFRAGMIPLDSQARADDLKRRQYNGRQYSHDDVNANFPVGNIFECVWKGRIWEKEATEWVEEEEDEEYVGNLRSHKTWGEVEDPGSATFGWGEEDTKGFKGCEPGESMGRCYCAAK
jgi:hypothetical protein